MPVIKKNQGSRTVSSTLSRALIRPKISHNVREYIGTSSFQTIENRGSMFSALREHGSKVDAKTYGSDYWYMCIRLLDVAVEEVEPSDLCVALLRLACRLSGDRCWKRTISVGRCFITRLSAGARKCMRQLQLLANASAITR